MHKLAAFVAAALIAAACVALAILFGPDPALAADGAPASPWADFLVAIMPELKALALVVLAAAGSVVAWYGRKIGGPQGEAIANEAYRILLDQAAGWLLGERKEGKAVSVEDAVAYLRRSYPESRKHERRDPILADDIVGALGRLLPAAKR